MIRSFQHKGLERFFLAGSKAGIRPEQAERVRLILAELHAAVAPEDMALPGLRLHQLKGGRKVPGRLLSAATGEFPSLLTEKYGIDVDYEDLTRAPREGQP